MSLSCNTDDTCILLIAYSPRLELVAAAGKARQPHRAGALGRPMLSARRVIEGLFFDTDSRLLP